MAKNSDHYAIVVGIDRYAEFPALNGAARDAASFVAWLQKSSGGGLPAENVALVLSPPDIPNNPFEARPTQSEIDAALNRFGAEKNVCIGKRLYFYFSGHAYGATLDEVGLLMANASPQRLGQSLSLQKYRQFFRESTLFDEVVFVLDCHRAHGGSVEGASPSFSLPPDEKKGGGSDFILLSPVAAESPVAAGTVETRGLLTKAVIEGLSGEASDAWGRVTALSLSNYVRWRMVKLAGGSNVRLLPEILLATDAMVFKSAAAKQLTRGKLVVEVPHWSAVLHVYDNCFRALPVGQIREVEKGSYQSETELPLGIYRVEVTLEGKSLQQLVSIREDEVAHVERGTWEGLKLESAAPLTGTATARESHMTYAAEWSRKLTWQGGPGGASRLFLFIRTAEPKRYRNFAEGLRLLDAEGKLVTDFSEGVKKDARAGWMAFCADLPPGFYMLRQGRRGLRVRFQPIYLCANWQTQAFLTAHSGPSLRSLTLNMASFGKGFVPDDETALAAEAMIEGMKQGSNDIYLASGGRLEALLRGKFNNPWLGILAAYALRSSGVPASGKEAQAAAKSHANLLRQVKGFLTMIDDHPDVRALKLKEDKPSEPFHHPPLLYEGLKLVQRHATKFAGTIPLDSLTDRILDKLLINSHWTAWGDLEAEERRVREADKLRHANLHASRPWEQAVTAAAAAFIQAVAPKAPVLQLPDVHATGEAATPQPAPVASQSAAPPTAAAALDNAALINIAQELTQNFDLDALSEAIPFNSARKLKTLLEEVDKSEVSASVGLPLARIAAGIGHLLRMSESLLDETTTGEAGQSALSAGEQAILEYVLKRAAKLDPQLKRSAAGPEPTADDAAASDEPNAADEETLVVGELEPGAAPLVSIEECVFKIKAEADRILLADESGEGAAEALEAARGLAERLRSVAASLLERAAFTAMTDVQGHVRSINGAFEVLLSPSGGTQDAPGWAETRQANLRLWEAALAVAPVGSSTLVNPVNDPAISPRLKELRLKRTVMTDDATESVHAYLNALRSAQAPGVKSDELRRLDSLLSELSTHASFFAYDTGPRRDGHLKKLEDIADQLEQIAGGGEARPQSSS